MSFEKAKAHLDRFGLGERAMQFEVSSATVELAAAAVGVEAARIAKTLSLLVDGKAVLIVAAGDARVDNGKFKAFFHTKAKMLTPEQAVELTGNAVGGVCPFGVPDTVDVYLDEALRRFDTVYPAVGSSNSAARLTTDELFLCSGAKAWIDVCKLPQNEE